MATKTSDPTEKKKNLQTVIRGRRCAAERHNAKFLNFLVAYKNKKCTSDGIPEKSTHTNLPSSRKFSGGGYIINDGPSIIQMYRLYSIATAAAILLEKSVTEYLTNYPTIGGAEFRQHCIEANNTIHMTERCERVTPVKIDLDFHYMDEKTKTKGRILTVREKDDLVRVILEACDQWLDKETVRTWTDDMVQSGTPPQNAAPGTPVPDLPYNPREVLIFQRARAKIDNSVPGTKHRYKDGLHIIMPEMLLNVLGQQVIRAHVVHHMQSVGLMCYKLTKGGKIHPPTEVYDANPNKVGHYWMMHGSNKANKKTHVSDDKLVDKPNDFNAYKLARVLRVGVRHGDYAVETVDASKYVDELSKEYKDDDLLSVLKDRALAAEAERVLAMVVHLRMRSCLERRSVARLRDDFQIDPAFSVLWEEGLIPRTRQHDAEESPAAGSTCTLSADLVVYCARLVADVLSKERAGSYAEWFRVLRALANISPPGDSVLLEACIAWSKKAPQYAARADRACREQWSHMRQSIGSSGPRQLALRSIEMAAQLDNPKLFDIVQNENSRKLLMDSLKTRDYDIARVIVEKDNVAATYKCVSQQRKEWFHWETKSGLWEHGEGENPLEMRVPTVVYKDLKRVIDNHCKMKIDAAKEDEKLVYAAVKEKAQSLKKIDCLMNNGKMSAVGSLTAKILTEKGFGDKLDQHLDIISIGDGLVYDLKNGARRARPSDFVSMSTNQPISMRPEAGRRMSSNFTLDHPHVVAVLQFIKDIFPSDSTRDYMLKWMASMAGGHTSDELFHILIGSGANGKSKLQELLKLAYGEYCVTVPVTMFTGVRGDAQGCTSAYEHIRNKRTVFIQEPDAGQRLNAGVLKELSGGDSLYSRGLYQKAKEFKPQATFVLITNNKPAVPADDQALWRRLRIVTFKTKFKAKPDPSKPEEKLRDNSISEKLKIWAPAFQWVLLERYYPIYLEEGLTVMPRDIAMATKEYQSEYDEVNTFIEENIIHVSDATPDINGGVVERVVLQHLIAKWKQHVTNPHHPSAAYKNKTSKQHVIDIFSKYLKEDPCKFDDDKEIGWHNYIWTNSCA